MCSWVQRSGIWWAEGQEPITHHQLLSCSLFFAHSLRFVMVWKSMETAGICCALIASWNMRPLRVKVKRKKQQGRCFWSCLLFALLGRLYMKRNWFQFSLVQLLSRVRLFAIPWTAACQTLLSSTITQSLLKCMSIESVMLSNHFTLCCPLLLWPSVFPSIRVFSNESALCIRWPEY